MSPGVISFTALLAATCALALPVVDQPRVSYSDSKLSVRDDWFRSIVAHDVVSANANSHTLLFCIKQNNIDILKQRLDRVSDPASSEFQQHLTFDQIGNIISNTVGTTSVVDWLKENGATIDTVTPRGEYVRATATVALWSRLLDTEFFTLQHTASSQRLTRCNAYSLPASVAQHVQSIAYTTQLPARRSSAGPIRQIMGESTSTTTPKVLRAAYNINSTGSGGSQSVFESLGQAYSPSDLKAFATANGFTAPSITDIGGHQSDTTCESDPNNCGEANLDVQYIAAVAPDVPTTFWYVAETNSEFFDYLVAVAKQAKPVLVHSISYGSIEEEVESSVKDSFDTEMIKLGLMGVTVLVASGDDGVANFQARSSQSACGYHPSYPATSPYVTAVGATQGIETGSEEIACTSATGGVITTGGGFSSYYSQPSWQKSAVTDYFKVAKAPKSGYNKAGRGYPDVAMAGYNYEVTVGGQRLTESGTSASTPVLAGMISLVNSARLAAGKSSLGFLNPALYASNASAIFTDVTSGENKCCASPRPQAAVCCTQGFYASKGWDPLTGWGSIDFAKLKSLMA